MASTTTAASALAAFATSAREHVDELERLHTKNTVEHAFQPSFWVQHDEFTLARDVFLAAGGSIEHEVTKFALVFSKTPSKEEAQSICEAMTKPCEQLLAATKVALFCGAGPSLADDLILGALRVMKNIRDLSTCVENQQLARVPELTGRVWNCCKVLPNLPKSNCIASKRSMLQCVSVLNDTIKELREFLTEQEPGEQSRNSDQQEALDAVEVDEDLFAFDAQLSSDERAMFQSGLGLLEMAVALLKRGVLAVKNIPSEDAQKDMIAWTATVDRSYKTLQSAVVDIGAALYPPVDVEELETALRDVETAGLAVLTNLQTQPTLSESEAAALAKGRAAFIKQVSAVQTQLELARAADA